MNVLNVLVGLNSVILIFLIVNAFKPFIGSYAAKKGENLATKEDIAQLTKIAEGIRSEISDKVWDRQEQWKLKRDAVLGAQHALDALGDALTKFDSTFSVPEELCDDNAREAQKTLQLGALHLFQESSTAYVHAMSVTDLVIGGQLPKDLSNYFQFVCRLVVGMQNIKQRALAKSETRKELADKNTAVIRSARAALGVKDAGNSLLFSASN